MEAPHSGERRQPLLLVLGLACVLVGAIVLVMSLRSPGPPTDADDVVPALAGESQSPSMVWPVAGGLGLALGFGLIGIGMNRWNQIR